MTTKAPREASAQPQFTSSALAEIRLTAPGAMLLILVPTVLGGLLDGLFGVGYGILTGLGFLAGCVVAVLKTRPRDLAPLAVTPPLLFVAGVAIAETLRSLGTDSWLRNQVVAITTALAANALWIAIGTGAVLIVALSRGPLRASETRTSHARERGQAERPRTQTPTKKPHKET